MHAKAAQKAYWSKEDFLSPRTLVHGHFWSMGQWAIRYTLIHKTVEKHQPRWLSGSVLRRWLGGLGFEAGSERDFKLLLQSSLSFYRSLGWRGGWMRGERN